MTHGTFSAYTNHACRCDECREANRLHMVATRARLRLRPAADVAHGWSGYVNWGCRCETCAAANAAHSRGVRERARQRAETAAS